VELQLATARRVQNDGRCGFAWLRCCLRTHHDSLIAEEQRIEDAALLFYVHLYVDGRVDGLAVAKAKPSDMHDKAYWKEDMNKRYSTTVSCPLCFIFAGLGSPSLIIIRLRPPHSTCYLEGGR